MPRQHAHVARDKMRAMDNYINKQLPAWLGPENRIRRITLDTGATNTFLYTDIETALTNPLRYHVNLMTSEAVYSITVGLNVLGGTTLPNHMPP